MNRVTYRNLLAAVLALALAGQARPQAPVPTAAQEYRIGTGDVLQVSVWGEPSLSERAVVRPDGKITLPLLRDVDAKDLTTTEAANNFALQFARFVKKPQVSVVVAEVHSKFVYVTGEVQRPGAYPLLTPINLVQLIARAGGVTPFAKAKNVYVLRRSETVRLKVNYKALLQGNHPEENYELAYGDTVVIP